MPHISAEMRRCIDVCLECQRVCLETITHCLQKGGEHAAPDHIRTLPGLRGDMSDQRFFMSRGSDHHAETCGVCAAVCDACAASCEALGEDPEMKRCADACRRCADECRKMAGPTSKAA